MAIKYRSLDFQNEPVERLFELYEKIWGSRKLRERWQWEYIDNPKSDQVKILIAEDGDRLVGATTRLPFEILMDGKLQQAYFSVNSMSDAEYRGRGIMGTLYKKSAEIMPLLYSKGTAPGMYRLLMKLGYTPVVPNTFMVSLLSPLKWVLKKLKLPISPKLRTFQHETMPEFVKVQEFSDEFDNFWNRVAGQYPGILVKTKDYMNWRYIDISHRDYEAYYHKDNGIIDSLVVLRQSGFSASIVDIIWDQNKKDEPDRTIRFVKKNLKKRGLIKLFCWGTFSGLRNALKANVFFDRGETPRFSVFSRQVEVDRYAAGNALHFVEGDGDSEYL